MSEFTLELVKLVISIVTLLAARYLIPWLKIKLDTEKFMQIQEWVVTAVSMAQQVYSSEPGEKRKEIVLKYVTEMMNDNGVTISDKGLDMLIEAAVKQLKIAEGK